jgi:hypothetical protein
MLTELYDYTSETVIQKGYVRSHSETKGYPDWNQFRNAVRWKQSNGRMTTGCINSSLSVAQIQKLTARAVPWLLFQL